VGKKNFRNWEGEKEHGSTKRRLRKKWLPVRQGGRPTKTAKRSKKTQTTKIRPAQKTSPKESSPRGKQMRKGPVLREGGETKRHQHHTNKNLKTRSKKGKKGRGNGTEKQKEGQTGKKRKGGKAGGPSLGRGRCKSRAGRPKRGKAILRQEGGVRMSCHWGRGTEKFGSQGETIRKAKPAAGENESEPRIQKRQRRGAEKEVGKIWEKWGVGPIGEERQTSVQP